MKRLYVKERITSRIRGARGIARRLSREIIIDRPIFLVGLQGGGCTLIRRILTRCNNTVTVGGNSHLWYGSDEMQNTLSSRLPEEFRLFNCAFFKQAGFGRGAWVYGTDGYLDHFRKTERDVTPGLKNKFINAIKYIISKNALSLDNCRFIDKSQTYGLKIRFITEILKEYAPRFLMVSMNPYLACFKAIGKPALSELNITRDEKMKLAAQHYYNCMNIMLDDGSKTGNLNIITFEDFLDEPPRIIKNCCEFLDLEYIPDMLPSEKDRHPGGYKWYPIRKNAGDEFFSQLTTTDIKTVNRQLGSLITDLGYDRL